MWVLTDHEFSSYGNLALLWQAGVNAVMRTHQARKLDYRKGRPPGTKDRLVKWVQSQRPKDWDKDSWASLPQTLRVRIVRINIEVKGFRVRRYDLVTTLLDPFVYSTDDLAISIATIVLFLVFMTCLLLVRGAHR